MADTHTWQMKWMTERVDGALSYLNAVRDRHRIEREMTLTMLLKARDVIAKHKEEDGKPKTE